MSDIRRACLDPETVATFVEGTLSKLDLNNVSDHLLKCHECMEMVSAVTQCDREESLTSPLTMWPGRSSTRWWLAAAAALALVIFWPRTPVGQGWIKLLVDATPHDSRYIEPRLTGGFPFAPLQGARRGGAEPVLDPQRLQLVGAAGTVLAQTANQHSIEAKHAAAIAYLIAERPAEASALLNGIGETDARILSDRGAASYTEALKNGDPTRLAEALATIDAALQLNPELPEALFNRALILERLGLRDRSRDAWERYIAVDSDSGWAREARAHLQGLEPMSGLRNAPRREDDTLLRELATARNGQNNLQLQTKFHAAASHAALHRDWPASISFLGLELGLLREEGDELRSSEILLMRAHIKAQIGSADAAAADLVRARQAIDHLPDTFIAQHAAADRLAVESMMASSPAEAIPLLTRGIEFHRSNGRCGHLPEMYLQRGRALTALGRVEDGAADFEAGIREIENEDLATSRLLKSTNAISVQAHDEPWERAVAREELFDEAVALALSRNDTTRAFTYSERARTPFVGFKEGAALASSDTIIEYATLPSRLVIFVINDGQIRTIQSGIGREVLSREIDNLVTSAMTRDNAQFRRIAAALYDRLIAPVANDIAGRRTLVFVPDSTLSSVPFSALLGPDRRYVVEQHEVVVAPSATEYVRQIAHPRAPISTDLLLITGPSFRRDDLEPLFSTQREADAVEAVYGTGVERTPGGGKADFEERAAGADIIHFVGHAVLPDSGDAALVTFGENGAAKYLEARDIAAMHLSRTRVVVLAACGTARDGENLEQRSPSLARAFLAAGVPNVVGTLWPIEDDAAAEFFPRLHHYLRQGRSPADALRATQLDWISRRPFAPLGMWAAVQIMGRSQTMRELRHPNPMQTLKVPHAQLKQLPKSRSVHRAYGHPRTSRHVQGRS